MYDTRFDRFLHERGIVILHLAATSGHSRQHILRTRSKEVQPTAGMIRAYTAACIAITGDETISSLDLFELRPDAEEIAAARRRYEQHQKVARRRRRP